MKKFFLAAAIAAMCVAFTGCTGEAGATSNDVILSDNSGTPTPRPPRPDIDTAGILSAVQAEAAPLIAPGMERETNSIAVAQGANDFAFALSAALLEDADDENFVVSPYSVWLPLAALLNATHENYRAALIEILAAEGLDVADINRAASRMLFNLTNEQARIYGWGEGMDDNPLKIANAVFVDYEHTLQTDFTQAFADYFRGYAINLDFSSPDAVAAINQWAYDNTNGRIPEVLQDLDPETVAAIANAIYFSDSWSSQFDPEETQRDIFHAPTGDIYAYFMRREFPHTQYFVDERKQSVTLDFATGGGMTILLPKDGDAVGLLMDMTNEKFAAIESNSVMAAGTLLLPRFSIENTLDNLVDVLTAMGMDALFCVNTSPLDGLIYSDIPCYISEAVQVAMIEVDEEGATAAAVTVMAMLRAGAMIVEPAVTFEMICDRPFAFVLHRPTHDGSRQILFTGVVNQP